MSSESHGFTLADVCTDVNYGYTESATYEPIGPKFLRITDIQGGRINWSRVPYCPANDQSCKKYKLEQGDIVIARTGNSTGENAQIYTKPPLAVFASYLIRFRPDIKLVNPFFLGYQLRSELFRQYVLSVRSGSAQPGANAKQLGLFPIKLIEREQQNCAVEILKALDDRITLLRETNATLEAIAQTLFKSWFVDFDPVRAKMEGRTPEGMDEATAALFPDSFEPSELGDIPSGWVVGTVSEVLRLHKGSVNPSRMQETLFQHFSLPSFDAGQLPVLELGASIKSNKTTVPQDAVLLSKLNPHIPRVWLPSFVDENAVCSTEFLPLVPLENSSTNYIYALLSAPSFCAALTQLVTGTSNSHQRIKPDNLLSLSSVIAPDAVLSAFDQAIAPLMTQLKLARETARTLAELRDALLPRLISGQLRLPEAEKQAAEA